MRHTSLRATWCACALLLAGCGGNAPNDPAAPGSSGPATEPAGAIIVNHLSTRLDRVPAEWIAQARQRLRIAYGHTSHGSQLVTGALALRESSSTFDFAMSDGFRAGVFLNDYLPEADLGSDGDLSWRERTRELLRRSDNDRNVVMWSWCGGVSSSNEADINAYLNAMDELERSYSNVKFVYMTGHLDGSGVSGNLNRRNEQIREFCRSRKKALFDFADIESYDPDGATNYMERLANDACDYDANGDGQLERNWARDWLAAHPDDALARLAAGCDECAHSERLNCVLKGRAFWWLMARLAGWPGV